MINFKSDWTFKQELENKGTGRNRGIDFILERFLKNGYYYMSTFSLYSSKYSGGDGVERRTRYDGDRSAEKNIINMIVKNKLDNAFGPVGTPAGIFIFGVGVIASIYSLGGLLLIIVGAFIGFTSTSALIDFERKRVKLRNDYFGIFRSGDWIDLKPGMKLGIKKMLKSWRAYSRGNRSLDVPEKNYRIFLFDEQNKKIMPLMKIDSFHDATGKLDELSRKLVLQIA